MEEPLPDGRVVAVAHRSDHVAAVVAEVLDGPLACDVSLVREEDREDEDEDPDHGPDDEALKALGALERGDGRIGHGGRCPLPIDKDSAMKESFGR